MEGQEMSPQEQQAEIGAEMKETIDAAWRSIERNRDSSNIEYKPVPRKDGRGIDLVSTRNNILGPDHKPAFPTAELSLELRPDGTWHVEPTSDSFDYLVKETGIKLDGLTVDPLDKRSLNAVINTVVGLDAILDRYVGSEIDGHPDEPIVSTGDAARDEFSAMVAASTAEMGKKASIEDAVAYLKTTRMYVGE